MMLFRLTGLFLVTVIVITGCAGTDTSTRNKADVMPATSSDQSESRLAALFSNDWRINSDENFVEAIKSGDDFEVTMRCSANRASLIDDSVERRLT